MDCRIGNIERCRNNGCEWKKHFEFSCMPKRLLKQSKVIDFDNIRKNKLFALRWERKGEIIKHPENSIGIKTKRKIIYERDKGICYLCDSKLKFNESTLDHVIPKSKGGHHGLANLKLCCKDCNSLKDNKLLSELDLTIFKKNKKETNVI